jgi:hypothetical protein
MSIEFVIIPVTEQFESDSYIIKSKIIDSLNINVNIEIDQNYSSSLSSRINKWKKEDYDIIVIEQDYIETKSIIVRFSDKGSKPQVMELEEFIELIASFEDETQEQEQNQNEEPDMEKYNYSYQDEDSKCIIV